MKMSSCRQPKFPLSCRCSRASTAELDIRRPIATRPEGENGVELGIFDVLLIG